MTLSAAARSGHVSLRSEEIPSFDRMNKVAECLRVEAAASDVHSYRCVGCPLAAAMDELLQQIGRQIIDDVPAHVFECIEHGRLAGTGHAGDEQ